MIPAVSMGHKFILLRVNWQELAVFLCCFRGGEWHNQSAFGQYGRGRSQGEGAILSRQKPVGSNSSAAPLGGGDGEKEEMTISFSWKDIDHDDRRTIAKAGA